MLKKTIRITAVAFLISLFTIFSPLNILAEMPALPDEIFFEEITLHFNDTEEPSETEIININLKPCGLKGVANLSHLDDPIILTNGFLEVNTGGNFEINKVTSGNGSNPSAGEILPPGEQLLITGENPFNFITELDGYDSQNDGISMGKIRDLSGNALIIEGKLSLSDELINNFTLILILNDLIMGDLNDDGAINISDVILLLRNIVALEQFDANQKLIGNVNANDEISVADAVMILKHIVGLTDNFDAEKPLLLNDASFNYRTANTNIEYPQIPVVFPEMDGLNGFILLGDIYITEGKLNVSKSASLKITGIRTGLTANLSNSEVMDYFKVFGDVYDLTKGENTFTAPNLSDDDSNIEGTKASELRDLLGNFTIEGILFSDFGDVEIVSLRVVFF